MKNFAIMKTADLKSELDAIGEVYPVSKTGKFDRVAAIDILRRSESLADRGTRLKSEMVSVVFHNTDDEANGNGPIYVSVANADSTTDFLIPRETEVDIPYYVLKTIDNAVEEVLYQVEENGRFVSKIRKRKRFNYTITNTYIKGQEDNDESEQAEV